MNKQTIQVYLGASGYRRYERPTWAGFGPSSKTKTIGCHTVREASVRVEVIGVGTKNSPVAVDFLAHECHELSSPHPPAAS
jgi:hypothetical protein